MPLLARAMALHITEQRDLIKSLPQFAGQRKQSCPYLMQCSILSSHIRCIPGNGCTLEAPSRVGDDDRGLLVGDLDLVLRGFGRAKEVKSRFSNKLSSLWRTRNGFLWFTTVSSGLGVLVSLRRDGEGERDIWLEPEGLIDRRLVLNVLFVRRSSTPESWNQQLLFRVVVVVIANYAIKQNFAVKNGCLEDMMASERTHFSKKYMPI